MNLITGSVLAALQSREGDTGRLGLHEQAQLSQDKLHRFNEIKQVFTG